MGIYLDLNISKSVTKEEWSRVYKETLILVEHLPFSEIRSVNIHGIETNCYVRTKHDDNNGGWRTDGDYDLMRGAESFFLPADLVKDRKVIPDAGDAMISVLPGCLDIDWNDKKCKNSYELWGNKTQGELYHTYLLAVGCLIEARLGNKAYLYGDITRGQCRKAVEIANEYLDNPIEMPDRCDADRFSKRVSQLNLTEIEKLTVFEHFYLGTKEADFGESMRNAFSEETIDRYWKKQFSCCCVDTNRFSDLFNEYMTMGFDLEKLCEYVKWQGEDGNDQSEAFIRRVMDAKLHLKEKNCKDYLKIDQETERPYSIWTLFAQIGFSGAKNKKVDRYIPIEEIRRALNKGLGGRCDVDRIIDEYLEKEAEQGKIDLAKANESEEKFEEAVRQDASEVFTGIYEKKKEDFQKEREAYDITAVKILKFYDNGMSIHPALENAIGKLRKIMDSFLDTKVYKTLAAFDAHTKCMWLFQNSDYFYMLRDQDWEKIYRNVENDENAFGRYYSVLRGQMNNDEIREACVAMLINDDLYEYTKVLAEQVEDTEDDSEDA